MKVQAAEANSFQLLDEAEYMDERVERRHEVSRIQVYRDRSLLRTLKSAEILMEYN